MTKSNATIHSACVYDGRIIRVDLDHVRFPDGSEGDLEMVRHPGAAAVVPVASPLETSRDPTILMLRQYRYAADGIIWEIPAGVLDDGESPETCARRELAEEAGVEAGRMERLTTIFTTPGFTDEQIHLFAAYDLTPGTRETEPDEFIEVRPVSLSDALTLIRDGEIVDGKTIVGLLFFAGFRAGL